MPKDLTAGNFRQGQMDYRRKGQLLCVRWKDKRDINMLTTKHLPTMRTVATGTEPNKQKPCCNVDYSKYMCGVDHSDQMLAYAPLHRKTVKWWKKLSFHLITLAMVQAHCLYNKHKKNQAKKIMSFEDFAISVAKGIADMNESEAPERITEADQADRLKGRHFLESIEQGRKKTKNCHVCYHKAVRANVPYAERKRYRKSTSYRCKTCKVPLCIEPCMELYHTKKDFDH